jgi:hypothetical protein
MAEPRDHTIKKPKVMECVCEHEFQDKRYGKWMRLHNPAKEDVYRCTVCGRERNTNAN